MSTHLDGFDTAKLVSGLISLDGYQGETSERVVHDAESLLDARDLNDVLEATWEARISAYLTIHTNSALCEDDTGFTVIARQVQAVAQN